MIDHDDIPKTLMQAVRYFADPDICDGPETWAAIPGEAHYEVSTFGRVRSLARRTKQGHGWRDVPGVMLAQHPDPAGYMTVRVAGRTERVHRLVLLAFVGPCPDGCESRHGDGSPANNHVRNLSWATHEVNIGDRRTHGTAPIGERAGGAVLTEADVRDILAELAAGKTQQQISDSKGVSRSLISRIKLRKVWSHVTI